MDLTVRRTVTDEGANLSTADMEGQSAEPRLFSLYSSPKADAAISHTQGRVGRKEDVGDAADTSLVHDCQPLPLLCGQGGEVCI